MIDPISLGITAVSTGMSIFGGMQKADAEQAKEEAAAKAAAKNAQAEADARVRSYKAQLKIKENQYTLDKGAYSQRIAEYNRSVSESNRAAAKAYGRVSLQQNEALRSAAFTTLGQQVQLARMKGSSAARGMTGRSAARLDADPIKAFSRSQAKLAETLLSGQIASQGRMDDIRDQAFGAQRSAYGQIGMAPVKPLDVPMPTTPVNTTSSGSGSGYGAMEIAGDVLGGVKQYNSLAPEGYGLNFQNKSFKFNQQ